ncbi:MAG: PilZ domain-containing protein [Candidatus Omnitrophota bacterium]
MMVEKRESNRLLTRVIAHCQGNAEKIKPCGRFLSFTKDISKEGAHIVVSKKVDVGDTFTMGLVVPDYFIPLSIYSRVVWTRDVSRLVQAKENVTEAGIQFVRMDGIDGHKLEDFIKVHDPDESGKGPLPA